MDGWMDGWMDGRFTSFCNSISVMIGLRKADYERLDAIKCCLGLQRIPTSMRFKPSSI